MVEAIVQRPELSSLGGHRYGVLRLPSAKGATLTPCLRYLATEEIRSLHPLTVLCKAGGDIFFGDAAARHRRSLKVRQSPFEIGSDERGTAPSCTHAPQTEIQLFVLPWRITVLSSFTPASRSRPSSCSRLAMSRRTGSTRSVCHARFVATRPPLHSFHAELRLQRD